LLPESNGSTFGPGQPSSVSKIQFIRHPCGSPYLKRTYAL
jgi:hypothetical protein